MAEAVEAIIFDLGGVILNLDYYLTVNAFKKIGQKNFDQLYAQSQQDKIFDKLETGQISAKEFRDYMKKFLPHETTDSHIDDAWNAMLGDLPEHRIALLNKLKNNTRIFLFSNTNEIHFKAFKKIVKKQHGYADLLEDIFEKTYYSHLVGKRKPNADAFELVLQNHSLNPSKTLFIDDSSQHIEGAKRLGIQTIHLINQDITDLDLI